MHDPAFDREIQRRERAEEDRRDAYKYQRDLEAERLAEKATPGPTPAELEPRVPDSGWYYQPGDAVVGRAGRFLFAGVRGVVATRCSNSVTVEWEGFGAVRVHPAEVELPGVAVDVTCADHTFRCPRGYWGAWLVRIRRDGREFTHTYFFGKAGTRSPVPDERHRAERLAARIRALPPELRHLLSSEHWRCGC